MFERRKIWGKLTICHFKLSYSLWAWELITCGLLVQEVLWYYFKTVGTVHQKTTYLIKKKNKYAHIILGHNSFRKLVCINPGSRHPTVFAGDPKIIYKII